jgi:hypothetical protein
MRKSKVSQANLVFKSHNLVLIQAIKDILNNNDDKALKGVQGLSSALGINVSLNNGSGILAYVVRETMKTYSSKNPYETIKLRKILDSSKGFSEHKILQLLDGLQKYGFINYIIDPKIAPTYQRHPNYLKIQLSNIWGRYLKKYHQKSQQVDLYTESIGRLLWSSILANDGDPSGLASFKLLVLFLQNADLQGELPTQYCEDICNRIGSVRFSQFYSFDSQKTEEIRFFMGDDGENITINPNTIYVYNNYIHKLSNDLMRQQGYSM